MADPTLDEIEAIKKSAMRAATDNRDEDLFAGPYERFKPKYFFGISAFSINVGIILSSSV